MTRERPGAHLDDVVYRTGFTRGDVVFYYYSVAPALLEQLRDRDVTVVRFPDGVAGPCLLEPGDASHRRIEDAAALIAEVEAAAIEFRAPSGGHAASGAAVDLRARGVDALAACCSVAQWLRDELEALEMVVVPVSDGAHGLQLRGATQDPLGDACVALQRAASRVVRRHERAVTTTPSATLGNRVLVDLRGALRGSAVLAPYSLRAGAAPYVAAPLRWTEVSEGAGGIGVLRIGPSDALERLELDGDLLAALRRGTTGFVRCARG